MGPKPTRVLWARRYVDDNAGDHIAGLTPEICDGASQKVFERTAGMNKR